MKIGRTNAGASATRVVVLSADQGFLEELNAAFGADAQIALTPVAGSLSELEAQLDLAEASVAVIDLDAAQPGEMQALERLTARLGAWPPMVVITQAFDAGVARALVQMRVADFLVKPVAPVELVRTCTRVAQAPVSSATEPTEAKIYTFLPAVGGAGVTTLALQSAMLLLNSGPGGRSSTCLVDLDFQHGACADYLDLEPRLNLSEIDRPRCAHSIPTS
jgi:pilus assembly protein CpaE